MRKRVEYCFLILLFSMCNHVSIERTASVEHIQNQLYRLKPVELTYDFTSLSESDIQVLKLLVEASRVMDELFLRQVSETNPMILAELEKTKIEENRPYIEYFKLMYGPWDRLQNNEPFINTESKPKGAGFYPPDMSKSEFTSWIDAHPEDRSSFESSLTMIRRKESSLVAVPYSEHFKSLMKKAASYLRRASRITEDEKLKSFLISRADAFLTNDYYLSEMDWLDLTGNIEAVLGPYETTEDGLFGNKASFLSSISIVDQKESEKLAHISRHLDAIRANLPIPDSYKIFHAGSPSSIKVVHEIFSAGGSKAGLQTTAYALPFDTRVMEAKGSKQVLLKNVMNVKFSTILIPIVNQLLTAETLKRISFDAYFNHLLMEAISHTLTPKTILKNGKETTSRSELKEMYPLIEKCLVDVLGVYNAQYLIDQNILPGELEKTLYASYVGGIFRVSRVSMKDLIGGIVAVELNYYLEKGAITIEENGLFGVNDIKMKAAIKDLARKLLIIEATGDYQAAVNLVAKYRYLRPEVDTALEKTMYIPLDIKPIFPILRLR